MLSGRCLSQRALRGEFPPPPRTALASSRHAGPETGPVAGLSLARQPHSPASVAGADLLPKHACQKSRCLGECGKVTPEYIGYYFRKLGLFRSSTYAFYNSTDDPGYHGAAGGLRSSALREKSADTMEKCSTWNIRANWRSVPRGTLHYIFKIISRRQTAYSFGLGPVPKYRQFG